MFAFATAAAATDLDILLNRKNAMKMKIKKKKEGKTKGINEVKTDKKKKVSGSVPAPISFYLLENKKLQS
jgi:hypothetical protein